MLSENGANQPTKYAYNSDDDQEVLGEDDDKFDEDFKVDHAALQGILNNTGIKVCGCGRAGVVLIKEKMFFAVSLVMQADVPNVCLSLKQTEG